MTENILQGLVALNLRLEDSMRSAIQQAKEDSILNETKKPKSNIKQDIMNALSGAKKIPVIKTL